MPPAIEFVVSFLASPTASTLLFAAWASVHCLFKGVVKFSVLPSSAPRHAPHDAGRLIVIPAGREDVLSTWAVLPVLFSLAAPTLHVYPLAW